MKKKNNIYKRIGACILVALVSALMVLPCFASVDSTIPADVDSSIYLTLEGKLKRHFYENKNFWRGVDFVENHGYNTKVSNKENFSSATFYSVLSGQWLLFDSVGDTYSPTPEKYGCNYTVYSLVVSSGDQGIRDISFLESYLSNMQIIESYHNQVTQPNTPYFRAVGFMQDQYVDDTVHYLYTYVTNKENETFNNIFLRFNFPSRIPISSLHFELSMSYVKIDDPAEANAFYTDPTAHYRFKIGMFDATDEYIAESNAKIANFIEMSDLLGYNDNYDIGYIEGRNEGYTEGFEVGKTEGKPVGYEQGRTEGYQSAYNDAYDDITDTLNQNMNGLESMIDKSEGTITQGFLAGMWSGVTSFTNTILSGISLGGLTLSMLLTTLLAILAVYYIFKLIKG